MPQAIREEADDERLSWLELPPARKTTPALEATFAAVRARIG